MSERLEILITNMIPKELKYKLSMVALLVRFLFFYYKVESEFIPSTFATCYIELL